MTSLRPTIQQISGKYRVIAQLGQGGTADVSLAVARGPKGFSKLVVLKSMRPQFRVEPEFTEMFLNEAKLAARLNHPNIVQTNEVFEYEGLPVIVMEFLEGQPLSVLLAPADDRPRLDLPLHLRIIADALSGLHYSHELADFDGSPLGVVHRDVSPHNIFVTYEGQVKVLDYGIAKMNGSNVETEAGVLKGKLRYMPPEQIIGEGVDRRADVYAVGVMLWEAATNSKMWGNASEANIMNAVLNGEIPKPSSVTSVDPALEAIILRATAPEVSERYESAHALLLDIEKFLSERGFDVRQRSVGAYVVDHFSEQRRAYQRRIQDQLSTVAALSDDEYAAFEPIALLTATNTDLGLSASRKVPQPVRWSLVALLGASVLGTLGWFLWRGAAPPPAPTVEPIATARLVVTASPKTARITIDGERRLESPAIVQRPRGASAKIVVEAEGHATRELTLELLEDRDLLVALSPLREPATPPPAPTSSAPPKVSSQPPKKTGKTPPKPPATGTPKVSCDPPFYVDERGVKRFKPACL